MNMQEINKYILQRFKENLVQGMQAGTLRMHKSESNILIKDSLLPIFR